MAAFRMMAEVMFWLELGGKATGGVLVEKSGI
jgi:hypothetical protein